MVRVSGLFNTLWSHSPLCRIGARGPLGCSAPPSISGGAPTGTCPAGRPPEPVVGRLAISAAVKGTTSLPCADQRPPSLARLAPAPSLLPGAPEPPHQAGLTTWPLLGLVCPPAATDLGPKPGPPPAGSVQSGVLFFKTTKLSDVTGHFHVLIFHMICPGHAKSLSCLQRKDFLPPGGCIPGNCISVSSYQEGVLACTPELLYFPVGLCGAREDLVIVLHVADLGPARRRQVSPLHPIAGESSAVC